MRSILTETRRQAILEITDLDYRMIQFAEHAGLQNEPYYSTNFIEEGCSQPFSKIH